MSSGAQDLLATAMLTLRTTWRTTSPPEVSRWSLTPEASTQATTDSSSERPTTAETLLGLKNSLLLALSATTLLNSRRKFPSPGPTSCLATPRTRTLLATTCCKLLAPSTICLPQLLLPDLLALCKDLDTAPAQAPHLGPTLAPAHPGPTTTTCQDLVQAQAGTTTPTTATRPGIRTRTPDRTTTTKAIHPGTTISTPALITGTPTPLATGKTPPPTATSSLKRLRGLNLSSLITATQEDLLTLATEMLLSLQTTENPNQLFAMPTILHHLASSPEQTGMTTTGIFPPKDETIQSTTGTGILPNLLALQLGATRTTQMTLATTTHLSVPLLSQLTIRSTMAVALTTPDLAGTELEISTPTLEVGKPTAAPSLLPLILPLATLTVSSQDKFWLTGPLGDSTLSLMSLMKSKWQWVDTETGEP
jgi:hypothetical protein